ncbi:Mus7/MMS22 family protein [Colletotrichum sp. SAR 10_86]|nr:Mus7/MMS22 family protein [Colletotrichum sp. SAR 10_75]KAI8197275.1 Mus7/MMS22 family protein [Colletotrichum sp. SAR 10_65]KAI8224791.1 Mus7/MMS22 family protein [Colletotrichum sp. SAR 10_86]KAI8252705.1 Mus7/MMS22 family protein [Colletotrichum sp. SAR 10_77]KAJ5001372.1 Mus7/MMS22 family protein [Colletotrichum sp. SAR 10_66]
MANWKELGEVPDSDDELDFDSQEFEGTHQDADLPMKRPDEALQSPQAPEDSVWDVPPSSQANADATSKTNPQTSSPEETRLPVEEPASSPLSSAQDVDDLADIFDLEDLPAAAPPPTRHMYTVGGRDESPDPLGGDDSISTSYVKITAPPPAFPRENDTRSLSPPTALMAIFKSHGLRPVRMPNEPAARRQRADEDSQEKDFEASQESVLDGQNETTDESQSHGLEEPLSHDILRMSLSPSPSPLRTSSPKHKGGPSSQPSQDGETDNTSLSDNGDLPSIDEIFRKSTTAQGKKRRRLMGTGVVRSRPAKEVTTTEQPPPGPTFQTYDEIYGVLSSSPLPPQLPNAPVDLGAGSIPPSGTDLAQVLFDDDDDDDPFRSPSPPRRASAPANHEVVDVTMADISAAEDDQPDFGDFAAMSAPESEDGAGSGPESESEALRNSLSARSMHLDSVIDDACSVVSERVIETRGSPEPSITEKHRPKRSRKAIPPVRIDVAAAQFRYANDPLPTTDVSTPAEAPRTTHADNQLLGLGPFGTHYTQHFDTFPLDRGVFFHESTLIGSGKVDSAVDERFSDKLWESRPRVSFHLGEQVLRWDIWTEQVSSEFGILMDGMLDQVLKPVPTSEAGFNAKDAARFVLDYVLKSMSFTDDNGALSFVTRLSDVTRASLSRLDSELSLDSSQRLELTDVLSNLLLIVSAAVRLCQKRASLISETFTLENLLRKAAEALVSSLLASGLDEVTNLYDDLQTLRYRERGIRSDKVVPHAWVVLMRVLESLRIPRMNFWDVTFPHLIKPAIIRGSNAEEFECLWKDMFTLLPLCEFDNLGVLIADKRHHTPVEGWNLPQQVLKRVFQLYRDNPRQPPSFNDYCRTLVARCHYLVEQWGWQKCSGIIGTIFDFFGSQNLSHLRNEEAFRSARFLDNLHTSPSLKVEAEDRCFHIFLKLVALVIKKLRKKDMVNDIRNLVTRTLPNHDRQYSKEQDVHAHDLAALRNHHDLLCTLFWAAPPDLRPPIHNLQKLVIPASSHKEACLINLRAWNQLARFVVHEESSLSFLPLANWQADVFKQLVDQYNSAAADMQRQFLAMPKDATNRISESFMNAIVEKNKAATMEIMLFSVKSSMDVVQYANSLELARLASSTVQLQHIFQHFSTLPADFPSVLLQTSLTTFERLIVRIETVFNEDGDSQDSMVGVESEEAILMLERELAAGFFSMSRCILANQANRGKALVKSVSSTCVEQCVVLSGMVSSLFVRCRMMQYSQIFKRNHRFGLFDNLPHKLSLEQRPYLPLFLSTVMERPGDVKLDDMGIDLLHLWLLILVQPNHCLRFENQLGQQMQRQGFPYVPNRTLGFVANPGYMSNRDFFEYAMKWMRQSLQTMNAAEKKRELSNFSKALDNAMQQMRTDLQVTANDSTNDSTEHSTYVRFVRNIISLITTYGTDICKVPPFFREVSKAYSPPAEDPELQVAKILSYGLKLAEGNTGIASSLFYLLLNNFKKALQLGRLPQQVLLLKTAMQSDAVVAFTLRMLSAVLHATKSSPEAYALLDVFCDALELEWNGSVVARQLSDDVLTAMSTLITSTLDWATGLRGTPVSAEHIHALRKIVWLVNTLQPTFESYSLKQGEVKWWDEVMERLDWFSVLVNGAEEYLDTQLERSQVSPLSPSGLFRRLREAKNFKIQDAMVLEWSRVIVDDVQRNWVVKGPVWTVPGSTCDNSSTQPAHGTIKLDWDNQELVITLHDQLRIWSQWLRKGPSEGGADDGKPPEKPASEQDDGNSRDQDGVKTEQPTNESAFRRSRGGAFASARARLSRPRAADELPPVKLPQSFLDSNVSLYDPENRINTLTNDLWHHRYMGARWHDLLWKDLDLVFSQASWSETRLQDALRNLREGNTEAVERRNRILAEASQWLSLSIDEMRSSNNLQSSREPLPTTDFADMLRYSNKFVLSNLLSQHTRDTINSDPIQDQVADQDAVLQTLVEQYIEEGRPLPKRDGLRLFDPRIRGEIVTAVRAELALQPTTDMLGRELKRPLTVVHIPNYTGRSHTRKLMKHVASCVEADIIHLDAQELGMLVGDYIGQDCAYSRGPISMMGYRAAEMNGRLAKSEEPAKPSDEDVAGEIEAAWVHINQQEGGNGFNNPMEDELQKIKEGAKDYMLPSVDRWENLKINAALEEIANATTKTSSQPDRNLIIHVDDFVELNMTLEGALILGRLRSIVDTMWRSGRRVTLVGTSSNENPSEQYATTLKDIAAEECLVPLPLNFQRITNASNTKKIYEANDYLQENLRNIQHMLRTIAGSSPDTSKLRIVGVSKSHPPQFLLDDAEGSYMEVSLIPRVLATSVLPLPDVYHITRLFYACQGSVSPDQSWRVLFDVVESSSYSTAQLHRVQDKPTRSKPSSPSSSSADSARAEPERLRVSGSYNDYEKKLLAGLVNSNEIKTTFDDVHADPETKSALKLLTSLSLIRPEAFTYGVLATDRIPGCLLYGPPGTGKTLLAKAVAKESGANMLEVSGASINDMYVGQSEKNVRALFSLAKKLSPLVIFIDEADALLAARGQRNRAAHRETINQFLREWDGMNDTKAFIMVATNRPFDLDDAVLRRLPRKILVDLPLKQDRASILRILLKGEDLDDSVSIDDVARQTVLYSGSDLKNLCVAAAMTAVQEESEEAAKHTGPEPYVFPPKRTLRKHHFDKALKMIAASVSEDMDSLKSIRRFDEKYGDVRSKNSQKRKGMGFGVIPTPSDAEEARVRQAVAV